LAQLGSRGGGGREPHWLSRGSRGLRSGVGVSVCGGGGGADVPGAPGAGGPAGDTRPRAAPGPRGDVPGGPPLPGPPAARPPAPTWDPGRRRRRGGAAFLFERDFRPKPPPASSLSPPSGAAWSPPAKPIKEYTRAHPEVLSRGPPPPRVSMPGFVAVLVRSTPLIPSSPGVPPRACVPSEHWVPSRGPPPPEAV